LGVDGCPTRGFPTRPGGTNLRTLADLRRRSQTPSPYDAYALEGFLPLFESRRQQGITRVEVALFDGAGKVLRSGGATAGKAFFEVDQILLFIFLRQDILPNERGYRGD
jgi:hypothetical protein